MPDVATMEAQHEELFTAALAMSDDEPMWVLQRWGAVLMSAVVLEQARSFAAGQEGASREERQAASERLLQRWERARPDASGPHLFRALQIRDQATKRDAVLSLADRHPDDALVLWHAAAVLRQAGEGSRATAMAEGFVARNPQRAIGYRVLAQSVQGNQTRHAAVLERWAAALPGDPELVAAWLDSPLARQEPEATRRILADFFDWEPTGSAALEVCLQVLKRGDPSFGNLARACVAQMAADPDQEAHVSERATIALGEVAAAQGDWQALADVLASLEPDARIRALMATARALAAPERCGEIVELVSLAAQASDLAQARHASLASVMRGCSGHPAARDLFLDLLRRAPLGQVRGVLTGWVMKVNDVWRGELPPETGEILEARLREEGDADHTEGLLEALDIAYHLADAGERRFDLLLRWHRSSPSRFDGDRAIDLARHLMYRGRSSEAAEVLERQLESRFQGAVAETLWGLYLETEGEQRAADFARELIDTGPSWGVATGHLLAARSALAREDLVAAERHYHQALATEHPRLDVAAELLAVLGSLEEASRLEELAERLCRETEFPTQMASVEACAATLLTEAGRGDAAAGAFAALSQELPEDISDLEKLASTAHHADRPEVAEAALRRILELDPRRESSWTGLGGFLEKQGRADEVEALLERSREIFSPPPSFLARAAGRANTAAGRPERAIALFLESRGNLPAGKGGEWSRGWIDHELRQAYRALGETLPAPAAERRPPPSRAFGTTEIEIPEGPADELRRLADSLQAGSGGRYDPEAAALLYARAASLQDPLATLRLALLRQLDRETTPAGAASPDELFRSSVEAVQGLALQGDPYAAYLLGTAALVGLGGPRDPAAARPWLEQAAAGEEPWAWHNLAWMAETGLGLASPEVPGAIASYRRASQAGNVVSMVDLARLTLTREASGAACEEGLDWLGRAAQAGNARAAAFLGKLLLHGQGGCVAPDPSRALPWLEASVSTRQPGARYDLGLALLLAEQSEEDRRRGLSLLEEATQPDVLTLETLALLRASGLGIPRQPTEARRLVAEAARYGADGFSALRQQLGLSEPIRRLVAAGVDRLEHLAEGGDAPAAAFLARLYQMGLVPEVAPRRAVALARQGAAAGEPGAMRVLMHAYRTGEGVEPDQTESQRWRRRGAEAGDSFCMLFLGKALLRGEQEERDLEAGLAWLHRSAETGNWWAVADLGHYYDEGAYGIPRDPEEAARWKRSLAALGDPGARGWLHYHDPPRP